MSTKSGFGSGVTQNFYSAVANELLKAGVHSALPVWLAETAGADADGFIAHSGALFPRPLPPAAPAEQVAAVCARFRFLGRLMAKASCKLRVAAHAHVWSPASQVCDEDTPCTDADVHDPRVRPRA